METGELNDTLVAESTELSIDQGKEIDVIEEVGQHLGVDDDRRFDVRIGTHSQAFDFGCQQLQQFFLIGCFSEDIANLVSLKHTLSEGAQVEPDDDVGNPALRLLQRF